MTKKTPLEEFHDAKKAREDAGLEALNKAGDEAEKTLKAETDPSLTLDQRLEIFKGLQAWPRIVLGLYNAELALAQEKRKNHGAPKYGREEPSETAFRVVGEAVRLGPDRIRDLCREGRRHLKERMPPKPEIRAAEFIKRLPLSEGSVFGPKP